MQQSLSLGITLASPGWTHILEQEGIPFTQCTFSKAISPSSFAAVIVNSALDGKPKGNALSFLEQGGAILTTPSIAQSLDPEIKFTQKPTKFLRPEGPFFQGAGMTWLNTKAALFPGQQQPSPIEKRIGKGLLIALPFDPEPLILSQGYEKRGFFAGKASVAEFSPKASKGNIRILVSNCIKRLFAHRALPFIHLWQYPKKFRSAFCFHIDVDNFTQDLLKTIDLFKELKHSPTWFLNMEAAQNAECPEAITALRSQPFIGQHGLEHRYYENQQQAYDNTMKGHTAAKEKGFSPGSFNPPNGVWGNGIARAVQKLGYKFALGFSLDYDNFPFTPLADGKPASFLFLPMHPICIGVLKQYDFSEQEMIDYYKLLIHRSSNASLPILLYGHALKRIARFPNVVRSILSEIRSRSEIWETSLQEFAAWWKNRSAISFKAYTDHDTIKVTSTARPRASFRLVLNGKESFFPAKTQQIRTVSLASGSNVFTATLNDTTPRPSMLGKKHLAKALLPEAVKKFISNRKR